MSLWTVFAVSALGGGAGAVIALIIYAMVAVSGTVEDAAEAYEAGYAAAAEHWRGQLERMGVARKEAA